MGYRLIAAAQLMVNATIEWTAGNWVAMEHEARRCWDELGELGEQGFRSTAGADLAEALVRLGRIDEAEAVVAEADLLASPDDYATEFLALDVRALIASRRGEHDSAVELVRQALAVVERTDAVEHQAMAHLVRPRAPAAGSAPVARPGPRRGRRATLPCPPCRRRPRSSPPRPGWICSRATSWRT